MGSSGTTQSVSTQQIDPDLQRRHLGLFDDAQQFINQTPFQPFPGQTVAGPQPFQLAAQSLLSQGLLGQGLGFVAPQSFGPFNRDQFQFTTSPTFVPGGGTGGDITSPGTPGDSGDGDPPGDENFDPEVDGPLRMANLAQPPVPRDVSDTQIPTNFPFDPTIGGGGNPGGMQVGNFNLSANAPGAAQNAAAANIASGLGGFMPQQVGQFGFTGDRLAQLQNPFTNQVVDQSLNDLARADAMLRERNIESAGTGTFGGDRQAVRENLQDESFLREAGRLSSQLRSQGFDRAAGLVGQENKFGLQAALANQGAGLQAGGLNLSAANSLNNFGQTQFGNLLSGVSALNQFGTQNQGLAQDMINSEIQQFNDVRNAPLRDIGLLQSLLTGIPVGINQTHMTPTNRGAGFGGGALTGAGIGSAFGPIGAGIGGGIGGLLGLL